MTRLFNLVPLLAFSCLLGFSQLASADGFRCEGQGFHVRMYNQIQPKAGTRNPAVFVISDERIGTIAQLYGDEVRKTLGPALVTYHGPAHSRYTGHFVFAALQVERAPVPFGAELAHRAVLYFNYEFHRLHVDMVCQHYLKHPHWLP